MASLLRMPAPAAGVQHALLLEWSVEEKTAFAATDVLAVIETDKAVIEIEAEADGLIHRRLVPAGSQVDVGTPIAVIGTAGDSADDIATMLSQAGGAPRDDGAMAPRAAMSDTTAARIFASPIARRMAKDAGLALADLTGTGPGGRIVRRDVEAAAPVRNGENTRPPATPVTAPQPDTPPEPVTAPPSRATTSQPAYTDQPHSKIRAAIAARLTDSKRSVPHFYLRATPRVDDLLAMRRELNVAGAPRVSVNDLVLRAVARAHRAVPEMNVTYTDSAVRHYHTVDVAVAVATDEGLITPVVRDADRLPITEISAITTDFADRARRGRIRQQEIEGGSITVSSLGMFGVQEFAAIINPPQSAILAVGTARREPVVVGDELTVGTVMHLVLSVDHRPLDGVTAARWMAALVDLLEHPVRIIA